MTFRASTDHLEGFFTVLRLTFRGLPVECLGELTHEAASRAALFARDYEEL